MNKFPNLKDPFHFVATLGGIGMLPKAPGTFGSIAAWLIFVYLSHFISMINMLILTILFFTKKTLPFRASTIFLFVFKIKQFW